MARLEHHAGRLLVQVVGVDTLEVRDDDCWIELVAVLLPGVLDHRFGDEGDVVAAEVRSAARAGLRVVHESSFG
jgi:hypothetical protein